MVRSTRRNNDWVKAHKLLGNTTSTRDLLIPNKVSDELLTKGVQLMKFHELASENLNNKLLKDQLKKWDNKKKIITNTVSNTDTVQGREIHNTTHSQQPHHNLLPPPSHLNRDKIFHKTRMNETYLHTVMEYAKKILNNQEMFHSQLENIKKDTEGITNILQKDAVSKNTRRQKEKKEKIKTLEEDLTKLRGEMR